MSKIKLTITGYDDKSVKSAIMLIEYFLKEYNQDIHMSGPVFLPVKKKSIVLLRSPHVNKKSREFFQTKKHKSILILKGNSNILMQAKKRIQVAKLSNTPGLRYTFCINF